MSKRLHVYVGSVREGLGLPDGPGLATLLHDAFDTGSGGAIDLRLDAVLRPVRKAGPDEVIGLASLNSALEDLLPHPTVRAFDLTEIGLVIADRYRDRDDVFGLMFDLGADAASESTSVPRQGAAIFLDAIRANRSDDEKASREIRCTAAHELGHVFNLWHLESPRGFMSSCLPESEPWRHPFAFVADHRAYLARCETSLNVHPGGSVWGVRDVSVQGGDAMAPVGAGNVL